MAALFEQIRARMRQWPRAVGIEPRPFVEAALRAAATMFASSALAIAWEDPEEPWVVIATFRDGEVQWQEIEEDLDAACAASRGPKTLEVHLDAELVRGRMFIEAPRERVEWTDLLADIVSVLLARDLDFLIASRMETREAVHEERLRVARDLHDGLLQSFTGVVLQLETVHDMIDKNPERAQQLVTDVQGLIMADQRDLRSYVEQLRPRRRIDVPFDFLSRLAELQARFAMQWGIAVTIDKERVDTLVAQSLGPETFRLIQEAVTNAAKHGSASEIRVRLATADSRIRIEIADDGHGFPFHGRRTLQEIRDTGVGPSMLAERVAALNGDLALESSGSGAKVEISIPLGISGA